MPKTSLSLKVDVFVAGAAVMAIELLGSRLLAPVYGNTIFVWGSLIGVVLAALSLGYYVGGRVADRRPDFNTFSMIILSAGVLVLAIPLLAGSIFDLVVGLNIGERYGPLLATILLLAAPSALLGMVSPYAIRLAARNFERLGNISGNLYALSTVGSIFGTFLTVFVLIPQFGVNRIIFGVGLTLLAISVIGLNIKIKAFILILLVLSPFIAPYTTRRATVAAYTLTAGTILYEADTPYHHIVVMEGYDPLHGGEVRILLLDDNFHSAMDLDDPDRAVFTYTDYFHLAFLVNLDIRNALFIGGGGFTGPKAFLRAYPDVRVSVVEIDPEVIRVAREYFAVSDDPRLRIYSEDGRVYLHSSDEKYDVIVLDAYSKTFVPFHLMTREFFEEVDRDLTDSGVLIMNLIAPTTGAGSELLKAEVSTISTVFPRTYAFPVRGKNFTQPQNVILLATKTDTLFTADSLMARAQSSAPKLSRLSQYVSNYLVINSSGAPMLTDDYAPVETLLNPVTGQSLTKEDQVMPVIYTELFRLVVVAAIAAALTIVILRYKTKRGSRSSS